MSESLVFFGGWKDAILFVDFVFTVFSFIMIWVLIKKLDANSNTDGRKGVKT